MPRCRIGSYLAKPSTVEQAWFEVDATDKVLGRLAVRIATVLMGKHKPTYTAHVDTGDFVVVTNADKYRLTGRKAEEMIYPRYSYYPGGYKAIPFREMAKQHPEKILTESVRRMLPKNSLARKMLGKLKVYSGAEHPHAAQKPTPLPF